MGGYMMQLQNYSVNDGSGIRTTVFMAGCPMRCLWCSNPEGQTQNNSMVHFMEIEEIAKLVESQEIFYRLSGGGVTFSGGEATMQPELLQGLVDRFYDNGYHLAMETCGCFDFATISPILKKMDLIFMDLKHIDAEKHKEFTGVAVDIVLENIKKTASLGIEMVVRIPVILGVNGDDDTLLSMFRFLLEHAPNVKLELLPYHKFGEEKYKTLGLPLPSEAFATPTKEQLEHWEDMAKKIGIEVVSYK